MTRIAADLPVTTGRRRRGVSTRDRPLWLLLPGGVLVGVVIVIPLLTAVAMSLLDLDQFTLRSWLTAPFLALRNFGEAFGFASFFRGTWISVSYALLVTAICLPVGTAAALATQNRFRGRGLVRSIYIIPYVLPVFVVGTVWRAFLQPQGAVDQAFNVFGVIPGLWLNGPQSYLTLVVVESWLSWPFVYLLVLAGLQSVDHDVHEAAALDGAGWWEKLRDVVLPYLRGPIALGAAISFLHVINNFTLPFVLFGVPAPADVDVLPILIWTTSFQSFRFGLSAAMAILSLVILVIPLLVYLRTVRLDVGEGVRRA